MKMLYCCPYTLSNATPCFVDNEAGFGNHTYSGMIKVHDRGVPARSFLPNWANDSKRSTSGPRHVRFLAEAETITFGL